MGHCTVSMVYIMTKHEMHIFITTRIISRMAHAGARRDEALREILSVSAPNLDDRAIAELAASVPELPASLYEKWAGMFADRIIETVPEAQIEELCRNTDESNGALMLLYSMFMESERMEKVVAEDLRDLGNTSPSDKEKAVLLGTLLRKGISPTSH